MATKFETKRLSLRSYRKYRGAACA